MKLNCIASTIAALTLTAVSFAAHADIVDIDAMSAIGSSYTFAANTFYTISWAGIAGGGKYDAWQYNTAASGNFRDAFTVTAGSVVRTYDFNDGTIPFDNFATAADALSAFQTASGPTAFNMYNAATDVGSYSGTKGAPFNFAFPMETTVTFTVPDSFLIDNQGGVSLSITAAVPEPETYALMLAGLGVLGYVARRRKSA